MDPKLLRARTLSSRLLDEYIRLKGLSEKARLVSEHAMKDLRRAPQQFIPEWGQTLSQLESEFSRMYRVMRTLPTETVEALRQYHKAVPKVFSHPLPLALGVLGLGLGYLASRKDYQVPGYIPLGLGTIGLAGTAGSLMKARSAHSAAADLLSLLPDIDFSRVFPRDAGAMPDFTNVVRNVEEYLKARQNLAEAFAKNRAARSYSSALRQLRLNKSYVEELLSRMGRMDYDITRFMELSRDFISRQLEANRLRRLGRLFWMASLPLFTYYAGTKLFNRQ